MEINDAQTARAWLAEWSGKPRAGILAEAIRGLRKARAIANDRRYSDDTRSGYDAAIATLGLTK